MARMCILSGRLGVHPRDQAQMGTARYVVLSEPYICPTLAQTLGFFDQLLVPVVAVSASILVGLILRSIAVYQPTIVLPGEGCH